MSLKLHSQNSNVSLIFLGFHCWLTTLLRRNSSPTGRVARVDPVIALRYE
jgi:hypothetical protein